MKNELIEIESENGQVSVHLNDIPEIIASNLDNISKLENEVRSAESHASKAMDYIDKQMSRFQEKELWIIKLNAGNTKDIIEDTQKAVEKLADAQQASVKALKKSFDFQKKLAETSKYLFALGCANITANRIAVRAIELKLSGAGKEKISELARQEMMAVVKQLKEQEDILKRQKQILGMLKNHHDDIEVLNKGSQQYSAQLQVQAEVDKRHDEQLQAQAEIDKRHDEELKALTELINLLQKKIAGLESSLQNKANNSLLIVTTIIAIIALLSSLIQFLI